MDFEKNIFFDRVIRYFYKKFQIVRKSLYSIILMIINIKNKLNLEFIYFDDLCFFFGVLGMTTLSYSSSSSMILSLFSCSRHN